MPNWPDTLRGSETCDQKGRTLRKRIGHWKRKVSTSDRPIALMLLDQNHVKIEHFRRPAHISDSMDYEVVRSGNTNSLPVFPLTLTRHLVHYSVDQSCPREDCLGGEGLAAIWSGAARSSDEVPQNLSKPLPM